MLTCPSIRGSLEISISRPKLCGRHPRVRKNCIFPEEQVTIDFAYSCVVSVAPIKAGEIFSMDNIWYKRPGTGEIKAKHFDGIFGKKATCDIPAHVHIKWYDIVHCEKLSL
jgi:N-acetylneuraminate synthase